VLEHPPEPAPTVASGAGRGAYAAFISYSRAVDGRLAPALQSALQRFAKPWYRLRALRIFRDDANLSANPGLWSSITAALDGADAFVLLASPEAADSKWVGREVAYWLEHSPVDRLLLVLTGGDLVWDEAAGDFDWSRSALPPVLRDIFREEPRYVDLRWARAGEDLSLRHPRFREAVAELAAPLHGKPKDELAGLDVREHRRTMRIARGAIAALAALTALATAAGITAVIQRNEAIQNEQIAQSRLLAAEAETNLGRDVSLSTLLALRALRLRYTPEAEGALREALPRLRQLIVLDHPANVESAAFSPDGSRIVTAGDDGTVRIWSARGGAQRATFRGGRNTLFVSAAFSPDGSRVVTAGDDELARVLDARTGRELTAWAPSSTSSATPCGVPTGRGSPPRATTGRRGSGTRAAAANSPFSEGMRAVCAAWRSARTGRGWSRRAMTARPGSGTPGQASP
jgi:hypothetical protein